SGRSLDVWGPSGVRRRRRAVLALALVAALAPSPSLCLALATRKRRYRSPWSVHPKAFALVFGGGLRADGRLMPMLADRVGAAVDLYQAGRVGMLLLSGESRSDGYDEVKAMRRYAMDRGVPADAIAQDGAGLSTYASCWRARTRFGVTEAVLVTQRFHMPRAIYTARRLGIDAVGLQTPDWGAYGLRVMVRYTLREALATVKALGQLHMPRLS
ncbi:MAG: SanA/YdcF family protein, partial [Chloroflexota bacterium]